MVGRREMDSVRDAFSLRREVVASDNPGGAGDGVQYALSKGAVNSFTIGLSQEVAGEGIRVNAVSPGLTRTDMPAPAALERGPSLIPMGRVGEAAEIAEAVLWLLSDRASFVGGTSNYFSRDKVQSNALSEPLSTGETS